MRRVEIADNSCFLITDRLIRKYITGFDVADGYLLVSSNPVYFVDSRYYYAVKNKIEKSGIKAVLFNGLIDIKTEITENGYECLYLDFDRVTVSDYNSYKRFETKILNGSKILDNLRSIKDEEELTSIRKACAITQNAFYNAIKNVKEGITEKEFSNILTSYMLSNGAEDLSFDLIVAFGAGSAIPHHETGNTVLKKDTAVLVDMGCKVNGYCSDYTRTFFFGNPSRKFIDVYNAVKEANILAEDKITSDMTARDADSIARNYLREKGYDEFFTHSLGHGIGLEIHEFPYLSKKREDVLSDKMVFSIEPGVYFNGEFGVRIEDSVYLNNGRVERLFTDDKDLIVIN